MNFTATAFPEDIAERLQKLTHQPESTREEMQNALYNLLAICENKNNDEKYRTLYKVLSVLANGYFEIKATYYNAQYKGAQKTKYFRGDTPEEALNEFYRYSENHDLNLYTPLNIENIEFISID